MSTNVAVLNTGAGLALRDDELIDVLRSSLYPGASPASIKLVLGYCKAAGLDPMQKPVNIVPMWDSKASQMRDVVMPGINLYRTQASRSGVFAGMTEPEFGPDRTDTIGGQQITYPEWCRVTAKRMLPNGTIAEFTAREFWIENYAVKGGKEKSIAPNAMWTKRPRGQIAKCAEAQALRKAFPEIGGAPTAEEMEGKTIQVEDAQVVDNTPPTWPDDSFSAQLIRWEKAVHAGIKTPADILAMARSRGALTPAQEALVNALRKPEPADEGPTFGDDVPPQGEGK